jgi:hypothetical protein
VGLSAAVELAQTTRLRLVKGLGEAAVRGIIPDRGGPKARNPRTPISQT